MQQMDQVQIADEALDANRHVILYTVSEIQQMLHCSKTTAYSIIHTDGFPIITIGKVMYVEKEDFLRWLRKHRSKSCVGYAE